MADDKFHHLFLQSADKEGRIQTVDQWKRFVGSLVSNGCIEHEETATLYSFWDDKSEEATAFGRTRPVDLTFAKFEEFVMTLVADDAVLRSCAVHAEAIATETERMITISDKWGKEGLDAAHARQLSMLLGDIRALQDVVTRQVESSVLEQAAMMQAQQERRLIHDPIAGMAAEAAADGEAGGGGNALWFQKVHVADIERRLRRMRVLPSVYKIEFRHISCNGPHVFGHAPFFRCGMAPRRVEVAPTDVVTGAAVVADGSAPTVDEVAQLGAWYATRVDITRRQAVSKGVPFELEVVKLHAAAAPALAEAMHDEVAAHRELALSPYFAEFSGISHKDPHYLLFAFEHVQGVSLHSVLRECGPLCETQPTYRYWSQQVLAALCDIEEQCCYLLDAPVTLKNVFVSNRGTRLTMGRIKWGAHVDAGDSSCSTKLAARSKLLTQSFAGILRAMLIADMDEDEAPAVSGAPASDASGAGAGAGAGAADTTPAKAREPVKSFSKMQCMRGIHVRAGELFQLELPTDAEAGFTWDPPTVVAQVESASATAVDGLTAETLEAVVPAGRVTVKAVEGPSGEPITLSIIPLRATQVGSFSLLLYHRRKWEPLPKHPTLLVQVSMHAMNASAILRSIVHACEREPAVGATPAAQYAASLLPRMHLPSLRKHPYFASTKCSLPVVASDFEAACH